MSFAFMPIYTGDYARDTKHLTPEEHGVYFLLLTHCWDSKGPVPLDERRQCGIVNARSGGEIESLRRVLSEFFVRMDDGWYNKRMAEEIAKSELRSAQLSAAGRASAATRSAVRKASRLSKETKTSDTQHLLNTCSTSVEHRSVPPSLPLKEQQHPPVSPQGGNPPKARKARKDPKSDQTVREFCDACKATGIRPFPDDDPLLAETDAAGVPREWVKLQWRVFVRDHTEAGTRKADWRAHFRNHVRRGWDPRLWRIGPSGPFLTTEGKVAAAAFGVPIGDLLPVDADLKAAAEFGRGGI